jgi:hypothetical protein
MTEPEGGLRRLGTGWCKRCVRTTLSVPCPCCDGPACAGCGRCPPCDGDLPEGRGIVTPHGIAELLPADWAAFQRDGGDGPVPDEEEDDG